MMILIFQYSGEQSSFFNQKKQNDLTWKIQVFLERTNLIHKEILQEVWVKLCYLENSRFQIF